MNKTRLLLLTPRMLVDCLKAVAAVIVTTIPLLLIGRQQLGEAVIGLTYLVPVAWSANRWGQAPGMSAALTAALCFDFFFIPPFYTMDVGSLEGWLVLAIFMAVAIVVVGRIHASLSRAREAVFMYELSDALGGMRTPDAVAHRVARYIQQTYQTSLVNVIYHPSSQLPGIVVSEPRDAKVDGKPGCVIPLLNAWGLVGEIQIWKGPYADLPTADSRIFQNFGSQTARWLERTRLLEMDAAAKSQHENLITK
ncbi:MAG TPA: DUF4118 domain-containing protein [Anaerolineales bacterium]|nr:DUF4118 domain-containing protein [Anaerolineales bacterium]